MIFIIGNVLFLRNFCICMIVWLFIKAMINVLNYFENKTSKFGSDGSENFKMFVSIKTFVHSLRTFLFVIKLCHFPEIAPALAGVRLDLSTKNFETVQETMARMPVIPPHPQSLPSGGVSRTMSGKSRGTSASSSQKAKTPATMKTYEMPLQPLVSIICSLKSCYSINMILFGF